MKRSGFPKLLCCDTIVFVCVFLVKQQYLHLILQLPPQLSDNWQEELQKYISPDQLPQAYGGTRCEPDPYCSDYVSGLIVSM